MPKAKKNADQLVQDLISGELLSIKDVKEKVQKDYQFNDSSLHKALRSRSKELNEVIGMSLTDEHLQTLAGGKKQEPLPPGITAGGPTVGNPYVG